MQKRYVTRGWVSLFVGVYFLFMCIVAPELSPSRALFLLLSGAFLTLSLNFYLKSKE